MKGLICSYINLLFCRQANLKYSKGLNICITLAICKVTHMEKNKGYEQLKAIIAEIMDQQDWPTWDFVNNVLSCEKILGDRQLWFHWGKLLIVEPGQKIAGEMNQLSDWNTEKDGTMMLIPAEKEIEVVA